MNTTANYNLNQWEATDKVQRTDFNADNAKIDAALKAQADALAGKAASSAVSSLQGSVNSISSALNRKGNCSMETVAYTGNSNAVSLQPVTINFSALPDIFLIIAPEAYFLAQGGASSGTGIFYDNGSHNMYFNSVSITWSGSKATLGASASQLYLNMRNQSYLAVGFRKVG